MSWKIPLSDIDFGPEEEAALLDVVRSKWLTMGRVTQAFEQEFADYVGAKYALAVTNCTAALHMACMAIGLNVGDEVILPSLTFVATANAVCYTGATPVFADIVSEYDLITSPDTIEQCVSPRTRAIIVMHYGGYMCDMPAIMALAKRHNLLVIEDAAHAVGAHLDGRAAGTWGDIGCFSFFSNKNMTTGEGGMLVTDNESIVEKLGLLRSHGMTSLTWDRHQGRAHSYDVIELGYNYRIDELRSALGRVQLGRLEQNNERRRKLTALYRELLLGCDLIIPFEGYRGTSSAHLLPVIIPGGINRMNFMEQIKLKGVQTSIHFPPVHLFSIYNADGLLTSQTLPVTENVSAREVSLPLYPMLTDNQVAFVVQTVRESI